MAMISPETLRRYPHFAMLGDESLKRLAMLSEERCYESKSRLFVEGGAADLLYVLVEGSVDLSTLDGRGRRRIVGTLVGGDLMALSAVIPPHTLRFSGVARERTRVIATDGPGLRRLVSEDHELGYRLLRAVATALRQRLEGTRHELAAHV